jgi:signal transduction histidine kinase
VTIPVTTSVELKYYEILIKISELFGETNFEYVINDVTRIKASETLKKEIKFKSLFLAKIAHEFKNPIITISNLCQSLTSKVSQLPTYTNVSSEEDSEEEKLNSYWSKRKASYGSITSIQDTSNFIMNTGNYLMCLIEDLNYFSKMEQQGKNLADLTNNTVSGPETMLEFELRSVLEFCLTIYRLKQKQDENKKGVRILSDYDKRLPERIISSPVKLKQILINLLSNAYKFTVYGNIKLCAKVIDKDMKNYIHFEVSDTGTGIPTEQIQNLCKPFSMNSNNQNLNVNGSGLGLFIVNDLLNKIGSTLQISSTEGKGSNFGFDLEVNIKKKTSCRNDLRDSQKTIKHQPVMTESLKNLYSLFNSKNIHESSDIIDESMSRLGSLKSNKFESRDSLNRFKISEKCPTKKKTLKDFYKFCVSSKNIHEFSSNSGKINLLKKIH